MNILFGILLFAAGFALGTIVVYKCEERTFNSMKEQCENLAEEERRLRREREDYNNTRSMFDTIDDLPEYLRDKYVVSEKPEFTDSDEDIEEMYV